MSQNPMTSSRNGEENPGRTLFEMFASELPSVEVTQGNCTRVEWDGRTPYGQVGSDGVLRSTRTELTQENPLPRDPKTSRCHVNRHLTPRKSRTGRELLRE